jgi:hypothetical protein
MAYKRILIMCVGFDHVRLMDPIINQKHGYNPDKVYLLHHYHEGKEVKPIYQEQVNTLEKQIEDAGVEIEKIPTQPWDYDPALTTILKIIRREKRDGNKIFINIFGPGAYPAASIAACMFEDAAIPFFSKTDEWKTDIDDYIVSGKAEQCETGSQIVCKGLLAKTVDPPREIPYFQLNKPQSDLLAAFKIYLVKYDESVKRISTDRTAVRVNTNVLRPIKAKVKDQNMVDTLDEAGFLSGDEGGNFLMRYRRRYLDKWRDLNWIEKADHGGWIPTEKGINYAKYFS